MDQRVSQLAEKARSIPPEQRKKFLDRHCGNDSVLRGQVEALLNKQAPAQSSDKPSRQGRSTVSYAKSSAAPTPPAQATVVDDVLQRLAPAQKDDELGRLGHFRLLKVLGHGGMGVVFKAQDTKLKRRVALKVMAPTLAGDAAARQRFVREARAMASIEHEHVVTIYHVAQDGDLPYLAMQLLQGESLHSYLQRHKKLPLAETLRIGRQIAEGLAAAHQSDLIHRDIKPANIWLEQTADKDEEAAASVRILDFGLARATSQQSQLTQMGAVVGTPHFMSPEQTQGAELDPRSDLFSLGVVLYRMATGSLPFEGKNTKAVLKAIQEQKPPPPHELNSKIPKEFSSLVLRLLAKRPEKRWQSAQDVAEALGQIEEARPSRPTGKGAKGGARRMPIILASVALAVCTLVLCPVAGYLAYSQFGSRPVVAVVRPVEIKPPPLEEPRKSEVKLPKLDDATAQKIKTFFGAGSRLADPRNPTIVYELQAGLLKKSTDIGKTWNALPTPPGVIYTYWLDPLNTSRLLAGSKTLLETRNQGATWTDLKLGIEVVAVAGAQFQGRYNEDPLFPLVRDMKENTYDPNTFYVSDGKVLKMTKNHSLSWATRTPPLAPGVTIAHMVVAPKSRDTVFVATRGPTGAGAGRVFKSVTGGQAWADLSQGLPDVSAKKLTIDPPSDDIYLDTDAGVWRLRTGSVAWEQLTGP